MSLEPRETEPVEIATKALRDSRLGDLADPEAPMGAAIWSAVGKTRGVVESVTPGLGFLTVYALTADVFLSVSAPVVLSIVLIAVRLLTRSQVMPAIAGLVGVTASATVAITSGRAEDNFLLGFGVNAIWIAAILTSLVIRRPLAGWLYGLLKGEPAWRQQPRLARIAYISTWMWVGIFGLRLAIQVPLYLAGEVSALAIAKLVLGVPLYAAGLWLTWVMFMHTPQRSGAPSR